MAQIIPRQKPAPAASPSTSPSRGPARAGSAMAAPGARHRPRRGLMTSARGDNGALRGGVVCVRVTSSARGATRPRPQRAATVGHGGGHGDGTEGVSPSAGGTAAPGAGAAECPAKNPPRPPAPHLLSPRRLSPRGDNALRRGQAACARTAQRSGWCLPKNGDLGCPRELSGTGVVC